MAIYPDVGAVSVRMTPHALSASSSESRILTKAIADTWDWLPNYSNFYYSAPIYMGSGLQYFDLLVDSGWPETSIKTSPCSGCGDSPSYICSGSCASGFLVRTIDY